MIKAEWTNADALNLQPTCNQLATDCISRQAAIDELYKMLHDCFWADDEELNAVITTLNDLPSVQPEIIRCKDCLHWVRTCGDNQWGLGDCDVFDKHLVMCEGYCAWAERRTNGSDRQTGCD